MNIVELTASGLSRNIYYRIDLEPEKIIHSLNEFARELESEMMISAWERIYSEKFNIKNIDIAPDLSFDSLLYCEPCIIDVTTKNLACELRKKVGEYVDLVRKEVALYILCCSKFTNCHSVSNK